MKGAALDPHISQPSVAGTKVAQRATPPALAPPDLQLRRAGKYALRRGNSRLTGTVPAVSTAPGWEIC
ncbi:MAG: hypothetical protein QHJ82_03590, partial [Verrucomicrobiota bacterium]|nr:hypothetical protein [Verrucomicrobiota bacterium]